VIRIDELFNIFNPLKPYEKKISDHV